MAAVGLLFMPPGAGGGEGAECYLNTAGNCRLILSVGMAADANVIILNGLRELRKDVPCGGGWKRFLPGLSMFLTQCDHCAAAVLFQFARAVRVFAVTLSVGI